MVQGQLRADGIAIAAFQVSFSPHVGTDLRAEAKLIDTKTGRTYATATVVSWPPEVIAKVEELTEVMERAVGAELFSGAPTSAPVEQQKGLNVPPTPGLAEFLGGEDAPPV